jgi:hypothetical protein
VTKRSLVRWLAGAAHGAVIALALACGACYEAMGGLGDALSNRITAPRDKLIFACGETRAFTDSQTIDHLAFDGPTRDRSEVAVLVIPGWYVPWTLQVRSIDGRQVAGECRPAEAGPKAAVEPVTGDPPKERRVQECLRVALLAGHRIIRLSASSMGQGSAWDNTKVKGARADGTVVFPAQLGGLYSAHVCQPRQSARPVFWIRDEHTLTCVSAACPPVDEPFTGSSARWPFHPCTEPTVFVSSGLTRTSRRSSSAPMTGKSSNSASR